MYNFDEFQVSAGQELLRCIVTQIMQSVIQSVVQAKAVPSVVMYVSKSLLSRRWQ
jgi:hypothetical protein